MGQMKYGKLQATSTRLTFQVTLTKQLISVALGEMTLGKRTALKEDISKALSNSEIKWPPFSIPGLTPEDQEGG